MLPEERERLQPIAAAFSEDDLLRMIDVLAKADTDLRQAQDQRVTMELALMKMAHLRRLVPFAELVARVMGTAGALPAAVPAPRPAAAAPARASAAAPSAPARASAAPAAAPAAPPASAPASGTVGNDDVLVALQAATASRPSLAMPLRRARAESAGDVCTLFLDPAFVQMAQMHTAEYETMASEAMGRKIKLRIAGDGAVAAPEAAAVDTAAKNKEQLIAEASKEPAVREALDLFGGRIVDVREAK